MCQIEARQHDFGGTYLRPRSKYRAFGVPNSGAQGWRQLDYIEPHVFENDAFVALGGPIKPEVPDWGGPYNTAIDLPKSLWSRFLQPDLGRALRTWHYGAEATRAARSMEGLLVAPPLRLAALVPGVGAVDLVSSATGRCDADISLIPVVKSDADPSIPEAPRASVKTSRCRRRRSIKSASEEVRLSRHGAFDHFTKSWRVHFCTYI